MTNSPVTASGSASGWTCEITVHNDDEDGAVGYSITYSDANGNAGTTVTTSDAGITIDNTHPTLSGVTLSDNAGGLDVNNGDTVTLVFTSSTDVTTAPTCAFTDGNNDAMDAGTSTATGDASGWTCTVAVGDNDASGSLGYTISFGDANGNAGVDVSSGSGSVTIDNTHPTLSGVTLSDNAGGLDVNDGDTVTLVFTSSTDVTTAPTCAFTDGNNDAMDAGTSTATGDASGWTCTVAVGDNDASGSLGYTISFSDANGNAGAGVSSGSGSVTIDNTHPTLSTPSVSTSGTGDASDADVITMTFTSSSDVTTAPSCAFTDGSGAMANSPRTATGSASGWTCEITVANPDDDGAVGYSITFSDVNGNAGTAVTSTDAGITIDNTHPTLSGVTLSDNAGGLDLSLIHI